MSAELAATNATDQATWLLDRDGMSSATENAVTRGSQTGVLCKTELTTNAQVREATMIATYVGLVEDIMDHET